MRRVLITGAGGQLGTDLAALLRQRAEVWALPREELDICDEPAVRGALDRTRPEVVFNCAAFHNVDLCEREEEQSFAVNVTAVKRLAQECAARGARLLHFSTNYVFDGRRPEPYTEADRPAPRSVYAISKLAGEHAALAYCPGALVVRSSGLYGQHGSASKGGNFVVRVLARAREQGELKMVADQRLTPTYTADLAAALVEAVEAELEGLLHLTNSGDCSWHEFTLAILERAGVKAAVEPVETRPRDGVADRPLNGVLAMERAREAGLSPLRDWREALGDYMQAAGLAAAEVTGR